MCCHTRRWNNWNRYQIYIIHRCYKSIDSFQGGKPIDEEMKLKCEGFLPLQSGTNKLASQKVCVPLLHIVKLSLTLGYDRFRYTKKYNASSAMEKRLVRVYGQYHTIGHHSLVLGSMNTSRQWKNGKRIDHPDRHHPSIHSVITNDAYVVHLYYAFHFGL